jgi:hypothetical protein
MALAFAWKEVMQMKKRLLRMKENTAGSSLVSVLVAFVILMIGIAGFYASIRMARDMLNRAEDLNNATGVALEYFYKNVETGQYSTADAMAQFEATSSEDATCDFTLEGYPKTATITASNQEDSTDSITYTMYYYLRLGN